MLKLNCIKVLTDKDFGITSIKMENSRHCFEARGVSLIMEKLLY